MRTVLFHKKIQHLKHNITNKSNSEKKVSRKVIVCRSDEPGLKPGLEPGLEPRVEPGLVARQSGEVREEDRPGPGGKDNPVGRESLGQIERAGQSVNNFD